LVGQIETTLRGLKQAAEAAKIIPPEPRPPTSSFKVFLAHTEGPLRDLQGRVSEELGQNGVQVITDVPPPYPAAEHEQKVSEIMKAADLSVHLLDGSPGIPVQNEADKTYCQKQVEIGLQHARSQLIWLPKTLDLQKVANGNHRQFLNQLAHGDRKQATYSLIEGSSGSITREILDKIGQIKAAGNTQGSSLAGLLDTHLKDQLHALDLINVLLAKEIVPFINPAEDGPQKNEMLFQEMFKGVSVLIIVFGQVAGDWVRERLTRALQLASAQLKFCGIYLAPVAGQGEARQMILGSFPVSLPIFLFDKPEVLAQLLDHFVGGRR
jgi:hypothetical protein